MQKTYKSNPSSVSVDQVALVKFSNPINAGIVLPMGTVTRDEALTTPDLLTKNVGGKTHIIPAFKMAYDMLQELDSKTVRHICVVGDGELHDDREHLKNWIEFLRLGYISVSAINVGGSGAATLKRLTEGTVGGKYWEAATVKELATAVCQAPARLHKRVGATVLIVDESGSMLEPMPAQPCMRRIDAAVYATKHFVMMKRHAFARLQ